MKFKRELCGILVMLGIYLLTIGVVQDRLWACFFGGALFSMGWQNNA